MHLERVGAVSPPSRRRWVPRDCALYALALGAAWDELAFASDGVGESQQLVYPTFALTICAAEAPGKFAAVNIAGLSVAIVKECERLGLTGATAAAAALRAAATSLVEANPLV